MSIDYPILRIIIEVRIKNRYLKFLSVTPKTLVHYKNDKTTQTNCMLFHFLCIVICKQCYSRVMSMIFPSIMHRMVVVFTSHTPILPSHSCCADHSQSTLVSLTAAWDRRKSPLFNVSRLETIVYLVYLHCYGDIQTFRRWRHSTSVKAVYVHESLNSVSYCLLGILLCCLNVLLTYFPSVTPACSQKVTEINKKN